MPTKGSKTDSSANQSSPRRRSGRGAKQAMDNNDNNNNNLDDETETAPLQGNGTTVGTKKTSTTRDRVKVFGLDVTPYLASNGTAVFIAFSLCHIVFSIIFASLQEVVNSIDGFKFPQFMTIVQTATYTLCAFAEMKSMRGELGYITSPKSPIYKYGVLSFLTAGGMFFTNSGLKYISYPTRIIFKAGKPLPTMVIERAMGREFTLLDYGNVLILTLGITVFCFGDVKGMPSFNPIGVGFMSLGVILDSLTSNYEKKYIFRDGASHAEAMFFASLMGTLWTFITLVATDYSLLLEAVSFCAGNPAALMWLVVSSIGGYLSVVFIMLLIKCFNATFTECVKGVRKVLSIVFSYVFINDGTKTFNQIHAAGMSLFVLSTLLSVYIKTDVKKLSLQASQFLSRSQLLSGFFERPRSS